VKVNRVIVFLLLTVLFVGLVTPEYLFASDDSDTDNVTEELEAPKKKKKSKKKKKKKSSEEQSDDVASKKKKKSKKKKTKKSPEEQSDDVVSKKKKKSKKKKTKKSLEEQSNDVAPEEKKKNGKKKAKKSSDSYEKEEQPNSVHTTKSYAGIGSRERKSYAGWQQKPNSVKAILVRAPKLSQESEKQKKEDAKEIKHEIRKKFRRAIEGYYAGAGYVYSHSRANTTNMRVEYRGSTNVDPAHVDSLDGALKESSGVSETQITVGGGSGGKANSYLSSGNVDKDFIVGRSCKSGGSIVTGFGKFIHGDVYAGLDLCCDFSKTQVNKAATPTTRHVYDTTMKQCGIVPSLALRMGMYSDTFGAMFFGKLGASYINVNTSLDKLGVVSLKKVTPMISLGMQKRITPAFSVRGEIDYRFLTDSKGNVSRMASSAMSNPEAERIASDYGITVDGFDSAVITAPEMSYKVRVKSVGSAARVMGVVHLGHNRSFELE